MRHTPRIRKAPRPTAIRAFMAPHVRIWPLSARRVLVCAAAALLIILCALVRPTAYAGQLSFAWDYSAPAAAGYAFYCGPAPRTYTSRFDVGDAQTYSVSGLTDGAQYYCAVTAYD